MADPTKRVDYQEVARLACNAHELGVSARQHVAEYFGWTPKHANQMIYRARVSGEKIPPLPRNPVPKVSDEQLTLTEPMLICSACTESFKVTEHMLLARHTATEHKRIPTREERTPR